MQGLPLRRNVLVIVRRSLCKDLEWGGDRCEKSRAFVAKYSLLLLGGVVLLAISAVAQEQTGTVLFLGPAAEPQTLLLD